MQVKAVALLVLLAVAGVSAAPKKNKVHKKDADITPIQAAMAANLTILQTVVGMVPGAVEALGPDFTGTIFAPTDEAFTAALDKVTAMGLDILGNADLVKRVLDYHILNATVTSADLKDGMVVETLAGQPLEIQVDGKTVSIVDSTGSVATVEGADVMVNGGKGVIHVIDSVLFPEYSDLLETAEPVAPPTMAPEEPASGASTALASAAALAASLLAAALLA